MKRWVPLDYTHLLVLDSDLIRPSVGCTRIAAPHTETRVSTEASDGALADCVCISVTKDSIHCRRSWGNSSVEVQCDQGVHCSVKQKDSAAIGRKEHVHCQQNNVESMSFLLGAGCDIKQSNMGINQILSAVTCWIARQARLLPPEAAQW